MVRGESLSVLPPTRTSELPIGPVCARELGEVLVMAMKHVRSEPSRGELLGREGPHRLKHPQPAVAVHEQALRDEAGKYVQGRAGHRLGRLYRRATRERRELHEALALGYVQQLVAPL